MPVILPLCALAVAAETSSMAKHAAIVHSADLRGAMVSSLLGSGCGTASGRERWTGSADCLLLMERSGMGNETARGAKAKTRRNGASAHPKPNDRSNGGNPAKRHAGRSGAAPRVADSTV